MGLRPATSAIIRAERKMRLLQSVTTLLLVIAAVSVAGQAGFPKDVYPETGNRFPAVRAGLTPDAFGPGAIRQYSPPVAESMTAVNDYLRRKSGLDNRLVELAILVTAREMDCVYVWTAHEPPALKAGLQPDIIDIVKFRRPVTKLAEKDTVIVQLGREAFGKHKVSSDTFARAEKQFGKQQLVNIVALMGDYAATTLLLNVADQHVRPKDKALLPLP
jgi:4-carboxymuconolactone decarboxylase